MAQNQAAASPTRRAVLLTLRAGSYRENGREYKDANFGRDATLSLDLFLRRKTAGAFPRGFGFDSESQRRQPG
jgi:hypothetical protein